MRKLSFSRLAWDTASKRIEDTINGYLRVSDNPFTREQVVQYRGYEIPYWQEHGLSKDELYNVYRPASELSKPETIASLNGIPFLLEHETFDPDETAPARQIGSAGTDAKWEAPYLTNSLTFTNTKAIQLLKSGAMKELSLGYYYDPVFKKGKAPNGQAYDVMMTNIVANHIALVEEGRAGHDVAVHDSKPKSGKRGNLTMDQDAIKQALEQSINSLQAIAQLLSSGDDQQQEPVVPDEEPTNNDEELDSEQVVDPATPEAAENEAEEENEVDLDETEDSDEDSETTSDEDCDQPTADDDDEATADDDDEVTADEDEETEDSEESGIEAALAEAGLSDASDDVKQAFIKGMQKAAAAAKSVAQDSKKSRSLMNKVIASQVKSLVKKAVADARLRDKAKFKAANEVRSVLGSVDAVAFDSAGAIYKTALSKMGYTSTELKRMSGNESRLAFRSVQRGRNGAGFKSRTVGDAKPKLSKADADLLKLLS